MRRSPLRASGSAGVCGPRFAQHASEPFGNRQQRIARKTVELRVRGGVAHAQILCTGRHCATATENNVKRATR